MKQMNNEFRKDATIGELLGPAMKVTTQEEADIHLERLIHYGMLHGQTREKAREIQLANIGYYAGYYDSETAKRVMCLFGTTHPIFGTERPTPEEALERGRELGARVRQECFNCGYRPSVGGYDEK